MDTLTATHGLEAADAILNVVAHTLRNGIDPQDFVGRWSNNQFLVIDQNCSVDDLTATAERLKRLAYSSEIIWWGDQLSITASVGGTVLAPGEPRALQDAIAQGGDSAVVLMPPETP